MLEVLVTSSTRRKLLKMLWVDGREGTASELARGAGAAFSGVQRELERLVGGDLAVADDRDGPKRYSANSSHPLGAALRQLLEGSPATRGSEGPAPDSAAATRSKLASLGAPLVSDRVSLGPDDSLEGVLLDACRESHRDASVARVLPFVLARHATRLDVGALRRRAKAVELKHTVGFMLEVAGALGRRPELGRQASLFRDRRFSCPRAFFAGETALARALAEKRSPEAARRWGWRMNMGMDSFASVFDKFQDAAPSA